ncbi:MAG: tetratricopeptide repeat protein [Chthoniobacterales bacterium]|nr:tetratricopeptide repeat protein [Chthoniobacterales bacterium]
MNWKNFFAELKRRNVYRVAIAYAVVAWLLIQIATQTFPFFEIPNWAVRLVVLLLGLGFPVAVILAWALELTPEGVQLTKSAPAQERSQRRTPRALFWSLIAAGVVAGLGLTFHLFRTPSRPAAAEPAAKRAVAVLPFENLSEDKANAYFADGMQDEIITRLAKIGDLKVISRTSTLPYKAKPEKISEIARQLGVGHVVEGSVQRIADRVRINVQLIDAATDDHLWAELYDRNVADVFEVQSEVATKIASSLQAKLSGREQKAMTEKLTDNMAAYDAYLRGIDFDSRPGQTDQDEHRAADAFAEAVRLDPKFAAAWARLSRASAGLYFQHIDGTAARQEIARSAAETATRLNPSSPETLLANAYYRYHVQRDYDGARELFEKIQREVPSNSDAREALARIARRQSRWKDSLRLYEEASKLNPRDAHLVMDRAWTLSMLRQWHLTLQMIEQAEAIAPGDADVLENKASAYHCAGNLPAARAVIEQIPAAAGKTSVRVQQAQYERRYGNAIELLEPKFAESNLPPQHRATLRQWIGSFRSLAGDAEGAKKEYLEAKPELETLRREQPKNIFVAGALALTEAGLGDKEAALAEAQRGMSALPPSEDPVFGPLAEETAAVVEAQVGEHERAIERIERLLRTPYGAFPLSVAKLRMDPIWDPLRSHPRFQAVVEGPEPRTIYD